MTVRLERSANTETALTYAGWAAIAGEPRGLDPQRVRPDIAADLERAFDDSAAEWWAIARALGETPSAAFGHAPAAAANVSDFGVMLAWTRLVDRWAQEQSATLVICDDPYLFRHLTARPGVHAGPAPAIWPRALQLWLRGTCARLVACLRFAGAALMMRGDRSKARAGGAWLLVYGHPASTPGGVDGYFGDLMQGMSSLARALHIDCPPRRARRLSGARTVSLHGFGNPLAALRLVFTRWRPRKSELSGQHGWLIRRAAALEGGTAQPAAVRWQMVCQAAWLRAVKPVVVAWPWENHGWERVFVRAARAAGVRTIGYQHSVIGRQMLNYAPHSAPDGAGCLPDRILCAGESTRRRLLAWGVDSARMAVGGALRFTQPAAPAHDPAAPVFLALPFDVRIAREMVTTAQAANGDRTFVVKDHPMTPFGFTESARVRRTADPLGRQASVSTVIYAATTVGLEAILAGLPTLRFRPRGTVALDILPDGIDVPTVDATSIDGALAAPPPPPHIDRASVFAPVDMDLWRRHLEAA